MLKTQLKKHLQFTHPAQRLQDLFNIPETHIGLQTMELPHPVLDQYGENTVRSILDINQKLEDTQMRLDLAGRPLQKVPVAQSIDMWRSCFGIEGNSLELFHLKEGLILQRVSIEDAYARLAYHVLRGELPQRKLRLHFTDVKVPISLCIDKRIHVISVECQSLTKEALLLKLTDQQQMMIKDARFAQIHLCPTAFFLTKNEDVQKDLPSLSHIKDYHRTLLSKRRVCSFELDLQQIKWSSSHLHMLQDPDQVLLDNYICVPFTALVDSCLFQEAGEVKSYLTEKIESFEQELCDLLSA